MVLGSVELGRSLMLNSLRTMERWVWLACIVGVV